MDACVPLVTCLPPAVWSACGCSEIARSRVVPVVHHERRKCAGTCWAHCVHAVVSNGSCRVVLQLCPDWSRLDKYGVLRAPGGRCAVSARGVHRFFGGVVAGLLVYCCCEYYSRRGFLCRYFRAVQSSLWGERLGYGGPVAAGRNPRNPCHVRACGTGVLL